MGGRAPNIRDNAWVLRDLENRTVGFIQVIKFIAVFLSIGNHGPKFVNDEFAIIESTARLFKKNRTRGENFDG